MRALVQEKEKAIALRKKGYSYKDIMKEVNVAKSSISLWLKDLPLTKNEKQYLRRRLDSNISRGRIKAATANHENKLKRDKQVAMDAQLEFKKFAHDPLFHTGISLYWAEGAKRSKVFHFVNSDVDMVNVMLVWLEKFTQYKREELGYRLFVHKPYAHMGYEKVWARNLRVPVSQFKRTVIKPTDYTYKKRAGYEGCLRLEVPRSTSLFLKILGWTKALVEYHVKR
jgi:transposase